MIDLNDYLSAFPGEKASGKMVKRNWMTYYWTACQMDGSGKCMHRFLFWIYYLKKYVNMFELMEIS